MPVYTFRNKETGETFDRLMNWTSRNEFLEQHPFYEQVLGTTALGDPVRLGVRRVDDGFREVLSRIGQSNYRSNMSNKLSRR